MYRLGPSEVAVLQRCAEELAVMDQRASVLDGVLLRILRLLETGRSGTVAAVPSSPPADPSARVPPPKWLADALEAFMARESLDAGPGQFAHLAHRTPEHVNRTMHTVFGCDTTTKLNALRMHRAGTLLRMNADTIIEVCHKCGFTSLSHFYTCFKAHYGATPRGYRLRATRAIGPGSEAG
jgi:AraC-like DNA-binding protein